MAVGYDRGASVRLGGESRFIDAIGHAWAIDQDGPGLLIGADEGLVLVRLGDAPAAAAWPTAGHGVWPPF
jgi:hypothetical protein